MFFTPQQLTLLMTILVNQIEPLAIVNYNTSWCCYKGVMVRFGSLAASAKASRLGPKVGD